MANTTLAVVATGDLGTDFDTTGAQVAGAINVSAALKAALQQLDMGLDNNTMTNGVFGNGPTVKNTDLGLMSSPVTAVSDLGLMSSPVTTTIDLGLFSA